MEAKLAQQVAFLELTPAWVILFELHTAYNFMVGDIFLVSLKDVGCRPNTLRIIIHFLDHVLVVCRASVVYSNLCSAHGVGGG